MRHPESVRADLGDEVWPALPHGVHLRDPHHFIHKLVRNEELVEIIRSGATIWNGLQRLVLEIRDS
jgi:hypothetical protein